MIGNGVSMKMYERAKLLRRSSAFLLDIVGIVLVGLFFGRSLLNLGIALGLFGSFSIDTNAGAYAVLILIIWVAAWVYPLIEIATGASPGKWALGLRVRRPDGEKAGLGRLLLRALLKNTVLFALLPFGMVESWAGIYISFSLALVALIGFFFVLGPTRRTLQDRISGTAVLRLRASDR